MTTELKRHADGVEQWLPIVGYEGLYEVSDLGRVRRMLGRYGQPIAEPLMITPKRTGLYLGVDLTRGTKRRFYIHQLVLCAFVGPAPTLHECAHGDGDKANNRLGNLSWATKSQNAEDRRRHGTMPVGERSPKAKLTEVAVRAIRALPARVNVSAVARRFGVSRTLIRKIKAGEGWAHV